jgi:sulfonate transport system ATP-binding protein
MDTSLLGPVRLPPPVRAQSRAETGVALALRGVRKRFGANEVLRGIDLDVAGGGFVAVVGKSGCGKSTLLRLIAGLDAPTEGTIALTRPDGTPAPADSARLMFQEPRLLPWESILANVEVGLGGAGRAAERQRAARAKLARVGLEGRESEWPAVLSGGQKQRVALARALVARPPLLALDEPLGALDALTRIEMQVLVEEVWRDSGFTAILVTHDVGEAVALADRILLLDRGTVALDIAVTAPRPRRRGEPALAAVEGRILDRLFGRG